jgi:TonB family protein
MKIVAQAVLTFLLNAIWQVALIVAFAAFADWLLRGAAARYRHALWIVTLLVCLTVPVISISGLRESAAFSKAIDPPVASGPVVITRILTPDVEIADAHDGRAPTSVAVAAKPPILSWKSLTLPSRVTFAIFAVYVAFLLWKLALLLRAWRQTQTIVRGALDSPLPDHLKIIVDRCSRLIGVRRVRVFHSRDIPVPITLGVANPIIVLPEDLLGEADRDLLSSAIGHELVHVARRDYLWNLIFETISLPLSFHPAAAFVRRRIRQTRELCCDEIVATRLLNAEAYAHSLMKLIGSAPLSPRLISDTTIGLNQSDILEVRIMSLLNSKNRNAGSPRTLLIAAAFILAAPCIVGAKLGLKLDVYAQEPQSVQDKKARQTLETALQGLREQERELSQKLKSADETQRKELEARLTEVRKDLEEHERAAADFRAVGEFRYQQGDLNKLRATLELYAKNTANEQELKKVREYLAMIEKAYPNDEVRLREAREKLELIEKESQQNRKVKLIYSVEPDYTPDARDKQISGTVVLGLTVGHDGLPESIQIKKSLFPSLDESAVNAVRKWRFEPAMKDGQPVSMYMQVEFYFAPNAQQTDLRGQEEREKTEYRENEFRVRMNENEAGRRAERESEEKRNAILVNAARISMDQAIQIATSKTSGKVIECSLVGEHWEGEGELAKPSLVLYHVVVLTNESPARTHVLINAVDGSVIRVSKEEKRDYDDTVGYANTRREADEAGTYAKRRAIQGGVLNGKATTLPTPEYPAIARAAHASGTVTVEVVVDEDGNVAGAKAVSGHPLLQGAAVNAARQAKFTRTLLQGEPVRISGYLTYNFVAQ